jgi:glycosyltransferase involved in cell wall biosynthesis
MELRNKNILLILEYGALGGAQRQALGLAKFLTENNNCKVDLLLIRSDFETQEFREFKEKCKVRNTLFFGVPYLLLPYEFNIKNIKRIKWNIQYLLKLRKGLLPYNYELIIPYLNYTSKIAFFLYKLLPTVKTTFWHQLGLDILKHDIIEKLVAKNIPFVIGNAPNCFDIFKNEYPLSQEKLNLLPQYLTIEIEKKDKNLIKQNLNIPQDSLVVGMIAHYRIDKYFDLILDAFAKSIQQTDKNIHLVLLGNKDNDEASLTIYLKLIEKTERLHITNHVSVLSGNDVIDILNILDISVLMSQIEGMPNSVMEYMAFGLPAIVSNHPGCIQLLEDSEYLIPNNSTILESKLLKLIENEAERISEGNLNENRIKKFNLPNYVSQMENIINKYL